MPEQVKTFTLKKDQQRQFLVNKLGGRRANDTRRSQLNQPDVVDILVSLQFEIHGKKAQALTEETIMRAVAKDLKMPFKKLDPLELDLELVTKTIPKSFALKHLLLPFGIKNGVYEVAIYDPAKRIALEDIERANQIKIKAYLSTKSDIGRMLAEFFGFQTSITAAETHMAGPMVDLGNLEQYVRISSAKEITSSDQHIKSAVDHLFNYAFDQRASDIHIEPKRRTCMDLQPAQGGAPGYCFQGQDSVPARYRREKAAPGRPHQGESRKQGRRDQGFDHSGRLRGEGGHAHPRP
jgi:general secretion pathway protein E